MIKIYDSETTKRVVSPDYNYFFDKRSGFFARWGKTKDIDPEVAPSPEIVDFEVTTICHEGCSFCYKSNTSTGVNLSFDKFKKIFDKLPKSITQIAFGADANCTANPYLFKMMEYVRSKGVIPNITIANLNENEAQKLARVAGAVAVSRHADSVKCYRTIKMLKKHGVDQVNIHILVSKETEQLIWDTFNDYLEGHIPGLNAIVLLGLKQKGRGEGFNILPQNKYKRIIDFALNYDIPIGADSCSAPKLVSACEGRKNFKAIKQLVDPCESTRFSFYIDVHGQAFPCSFTPGTTRWKTGYDILSCDSFDDIWNSDGFHNFRTLLNFSKDHNNCEHCPLYEI